jgi:hypothetical protein
MSRTIKFSVGAVFAALVIFLLCLANSDHNLRVEAGKLGFDHAFAAEIKGIDHQEHKIQIFWKSLLTIPGSHPILARIWTTDSYSDFYFSSGDRLELKNVQIQRHSNSDDLILEFSVAKGDSLYTSFNKVSQTKIIGHPEFLINRLRKMQSLADLP